jgi:hypothetical protein
MRFGLTLALLIFPPSTLHAQTTKTVDIKGHFIGESVAELVREEPELQQQINTCDQHYAKSACDRLLSAVRHGQRAEFSNLSRTTFVADGGRLVKLTTLLDGTPDAVKADLMRKVGPISSETVFPMKNAMGAKWEDHLCIWDTAFVHVSLLEDNNPASENHHFVLTVESRAEHSSEHRDSTN